MNRTLTLTRLAPVVLSVLLATAAPTAFADDDGRYGPYGRHERNDHRGPPDWRASTLTVHNYFDGKVDVWVDGRFVGCIDGNRTQSFSVPAGYRDVTVRRPETGFVLTRTRLSMPPGRSQYVPVAAPFGQVTFQNASVVPMKVVIDGRVTWMDPGQRVQLTVETGNVTVSGLLRDCRGEWEALNQTFWLEPGQNSFQSLRPESGLIIVTNSERFGVRARIDGVDVGFIAPGASERIWVRYGTANIVLVDTAGRTRSSQTVTVTRGREARVVFQNRPWPPGRPTEGYSYGYRHDDDDHERDDDRDDWRDRPPGGPRWD